VLYRRAEALACWRAVTARVLLVNGELSPFAVGNGQKLDTHDGAGVYPHARRLVIDACGHMLHWEKPETLAGHLEDFFRDSTGEVKAG
jgi:pimeloyl-ACP methyl ester carboxylesterase